MTPLPHPAKARAALGLSQRKLAALVPTTQLTVCNCEKSGTYPKHRALRAAYLRALGLVEVLEAETAQPVQAAAKPARLPSRWSAALGRKAVAS